MGRSRQPQRRYYDPGSDPRPRDHNTGAFDNRSVAQKLQDVENELKFGQLSRQQRRALEREKAKLERRPA